MSILPHWWHFLESHSGDLSLEVRIELLGGPNVVFDSWHVCGRNVEMMLAIHSSRPAILWYIRALPQSA